MISWTASGSPGARHLCCEECGATGDVSTSGWRGEALDDRDEAGESARIVVYCPPCWRLYGEPGSAR